MTTGPAHYQLLARGRAVDTQSYVAGGILLFSWHFAGCISEFDRLYKSL